MKILAFGDVHLGASPDFGSSPYGPGSRLDDQRKVLDRIAQLAHDEDVHLCLFAGDAYHRRRPTPSEIIVWRDFIEQMGRAEVRVIACDGNHDVETADRPSALQTTAWAGTHEEYHVSRRPEIITFRPPYKDQQGVVVCTLPWTPPARLVASMNGSVARDEVNAVAADLLIASARELRAQIPEGATSILLAHWSVSGSSLPNGLPVEQLREVVLPLPEIEALGFDAVVLGHIHEAQVLNADVVMRDVELNALTQHGLIFYTGSPAVVDFGEAGRPHGVYVLDTETSSARFHDIADRAFVTVEVDLTEPTDGIDELVVDSRGAGPFDETDVIASAIAEHFPLTDAVVRIRYKATPEQARRVDVNALKKLCIASGASKVYRVEPDIVRADRARVETLDDSLSPQDALTAWLDAHPEIDEKTRREQHDLLGGYLERLTA